MKTLFWCLFSLDIYTAAFACSVVGHSTWVRWKDILTMILPLIISLCFNGCENWGKWKKFAGSWFQEVCTLRIPKMEANLRLTLTSVYLLYLVMSVNGHQLTVFSLSFLSCWLPLKSSWLSFPSTVLCIIDLISTIHKKLSLRGTNISAMLSSY